MPSSQQSQLPVTLADIAAALGVSESTVSRSFSDPGKVATRTRERVLQAAGELGYKAPVASKPKIAAEGIGVMVPDIANPFFPPIIKAIQARAATYAMPTLIVDTDERQRDELARGQFLLDKVVGLVLVSPRGSEDDLRELATSLPTVVINRELSFASSISLDSDDGIEKAVEHLWALGHRSVAYLNGPDDSWSNEQRRSVVHKASTRLSVHLTEFGPFSPEIAAGAHAADLVLASGATAVIAYDDLIAFGVMARMQSRGVRVGHDLSVVGIDDSPLSASAYPSLTTIKMPGARAGELAVDELTNLISRPGSPVTRTNLHASLVVRESTGLAPTVGSPGRADQRG